MIVWDQGPREGDELAVDTLLVEEVIRVTQLDLVSRLFLSVFAKKIEHKTGPSMVTTFVSHDSIQPANFFRIHSNLKHAL